MASFILEFVCIISALARRNARAGSATRSSRHPPLRRIDGGSDRYRSSAHANADTGYPGGQARRALVLCAAEHGFVGGFNERLIEAAQAVLESRDALFVLGSRGAALALERGRQVQFSFSSKAGQFFL